VIFVDDSTVKVGGVILPGLFKSIEITGSALVEEQEVEGMAARPKQAIGYEDSKVFLELILDDGPGTTTKTQKLESIQHLFKKANQQLPKVYDIINEHAAARGVSRVIFKGLASKEQSSKSQITASLEFWEYIPITVKVAATGSRQSVAPANLNEDYRDYLPDRGAAPKLPDKTSKSPAVDNASTIGYRNVLNQTLSYTEVA